MSNLLTALAGGNLIYGVGMLELGITMSYAKLVMDNDIIKMVRKVLKGIEVTDETLAVDVIHQVGCGGDFLMQEHTMKYMRSEQSRPKIIDRHMKYAWEAAGGKDLGTVANEEAIKILQNHKPMPLADGVAAKMADIIKEAEEELVKPQKK